MRKRKVRETKAGRRKKKNKQGEREGGESETNKSTKIRMQKTSKCCYCLRQGEQKSAVQQAPGPGQTLMDGGAPGIERLTLRTEPRVALMATSARSKPQPQPSMD
jgi:hypothetical protein